MANHLQSRLWYRGGCKFDHEAISSAKEAAEVDNEEADKIDYEAICDANRVLIATNLVVLNLMWSPLMWPAVSKMTRMLVSLEFELEAIDVDLEADEVDRETIVSCLTERAS